ncbi:hypothetical protein [Nonlabens sp. YIK11]|nr:hypothetical protein [Nonlabens sp. YIK11]
MANQKKTDGHMFNHRRNISWEAPNIDPGAGSTLPKPPSNLKPEPKDK